MNFEQDSLYLILDRLGPGNCSSMLCTSQSPAPQWCRAEVEVDHHRENMVVYHYIDKFWTVDQHAEVIIMLIDVDHRGRDGCWSLHWSMLIKIMIMLIKITIMSHVEHGTDGDQTTLVISKLVYAPEAKASLLNSSWCWLPSGVTQW